MITLPRIDAESDVRVYRGFRVEPCFKSPTTGVTCNSQQGWQSADINPGYYCSLGRKTWFKNLEKFVKRVDEIYVRSADGNLNPETVIDLRAAITRLPYADHQEHALAALEAGLAKEAAREAAEAAERARKSAEHEALKRLHEAAPDLLAALQLCKKYLNGGSDLYRGLHHEAFVAARDAIAKATGQ